MWDILQVVGGKQNRTGCKWDIEQVSVRHKIFSLWDIEQVACGKKNRAGCLWEEKQNRLSVGDKTGQLVCKALIGMGCLWDIEQNSCLLDTKHKQKRLFEGHRAEHTVCGT